jgi:hypothetical protein
MVLIRRERRFRLSAETHEIIVHKRFVVYIYASGENIIRRRTKRAEISLRPFIKTVMLTLYILTPTFAE